MSITALIPNYERRGTDVMAVVREEERYHSRSAIVALIPSASQIAPASV